MSQAFRLIVYFLPYIFVFIASLYLPFDADLGWHLKYGEYFFQHGQILRENIHSSMMSGYTWANGSWGTDIITYVIYNSGGFLGLTLAGAAIVTATFFFFAKAAKLTLIEEALFFPFLVYLLFPLNRFSFRGQLISLLLLGVLFFILSKYKPLGKAPIRLAQGRQGKPFSKILWSIPVLFFFWINLQAESFLGLAVFGLWVVLMIVQSGLKRKKIFSKDNQFLIKILVTSFLVTFFNPFGWGIHLTAFAHIGDPLLKSIIEYVPYSTFSLQWWNQVVILLLLLGAGIFLFHKKMLREYFPLLMLPLVLFILSFDTRRYVWPAFYLAIPFFHLLWQGIETYGKRYIKKYAFYSAYVILLFCIAFASYQKMPFSQFTTMTWRYYCEIKGNFCSPDAAQFLLDHNLTKNIFSIYNVGGFLIWNYPDIKPMIDGRMHMWKDEEGYSAYAEYDDYMHARKSIDVSPYDIVYFQMNEKVALYHELEDLERKNKWRLIYNDGWFGISIRVKKQDELLQ